MWIVDLIVSTSFYVLLLRFILYYLNQFCEVSILLRFSYSARYLGSFSSAFSFILAAVFFVFLLLCCNDEKNFFLLVFFFFCCFELTSCSCSCCKFCYSFVAHESPTDEPKTVSTIFILFAFKLNSSSWFFLFFSFFSRRKRITNIFEIVCWIKTKRDDFNWNIYIFQSTHTQTHSHAPIKSSTQELKVNTNSFCCQ